MAIDWAILMASVIMYVLMTYLISIEVLLFLSVHPRVQRFPGVGLVVHGAVQIATGVCNDDNVAFDCRQDVNSFLSKSTGQFWQNPVHSNNTVDKYANPDVSYHVTSVQGQSP